MYFRLVHELGQKHNPNLKWTVTVVMALHTAAEVYCITLFNSANLEAIHACRVTAQPNDLTLVHTIRGETDMLHRSIQSNPKNKLKKKAIPTPSRQDTDHKLLEDIPDYEDMSNNGIDRNNSDNNGRNVGNDSLNENISSDGGNENMGDGVNEDNSEQDDNELKKKEKERKKM